MNRSDLEKTIGYKFKNESLLKTAFTHRSYLNENKGKSEVSYERLEFLGDAILGFGAAEYLYKAYAVPEGELTRMRAALVRESALASVAELLNFGESLILGKGDQKNGRSRPSILADVLEAVIGAIYLDGGIEAALTFIRQFLLAETNAPVPETTDYKSMLQERVQRERDATLTYRQIRESGPDHCKEFESEALVNGRPVGRGIGNTKQKSEQEAARDAFLRNDGPLPENEMPETFG